MRAKQHVYPYQEAPQDKELPLATQLRGHGWLMNRPLRNRREAYRGMVSTTGQLTNQLSNVIKRHWRDIYYENYKVDLFLYYNSFKFW